MTRLHVLVFSSIVWIAAAGGLRAEDPPRRGPEPKLSEAEQALWEKAKAILTKADKVELYSVDPVPPKQDEKPKDEFRGWNSYGKTELKTAELRKKVLEVAQAGKPGYGAKCFDPRHGIRATADGKSVDLVICFECSWVHVFPGDGNEVVRLTIGDHQEVLDGILKDANVTLAPPRRR
jgi:hypothetical protein